MPAERKALIWAAILACFLALLYLLQGILLPFVAGLALAYLLDPLVDRLERRGMARWVAALLVIVLAVLALVTILVIVVPLLVSQASQLVQSLSLDQGRVRAFVEALELRLSGLLGVPLTDLQQGLQRMLADMRAWAASAVLPMARSLVSGGLSLVNFLAVLVVTPVVAYFILADWDKLISTLDEWLPRHHAGTIRALAAETNEVLAGFLRGQLIVCLILGLFYAIGLWLVGLGYPLLIGLAAGLLCFVPFAGTWGGFLIAILVAVSQFWPDQSYRILLVGAVFVVGQLIEGNFLSPSIVGRSVRLHPVWLIFALFAMGYLFGFVGLLIAVPFAAAVGVMGRFAVREYLASELYDRKPPGEAPS